jgi:small subunit ribosomal protein S1
LVPDDPFQPLRESLANRDHDDVRTGIVVSFDGTDVLLRLHEPDGLPTTGLIERHELSRTAFAHPSEIVRVGQNIKAEVICVDPRRDVVLLSAKACEDEDLRAFLLSVRPGDVLTGTVAEVRNFGVFVRLDGEPPGSRAGFIRVPELSWRYFNHASEVVAEGQRVTVEVLDANTRQGQVAVSLKARQEDPFVPFGNHVGKIMPGVVTKLVPIGIFVRVGDGIEGLIHVSELDEPPEQVANEGDELLVRVVEVDLRRRRIRLSLVRAR